MKSELHQNNVLQHNNTVVVLLWLLPMLLDSLSAVHVNTNTHKQAWRRRELLRQRKQGVCNVREGEKRVFKCWWCLPACVWDVKQCQSHVKVLTLTMKGRDAILYLLFSVCPCFSLWILKSPKNNWERVWYPQNHHPKWASCLKWGSPRRKRSHLTERQSSVSSGNRRKGRRLAQAINWRTATSP